MAKSNLKRALKLIGALLVGFTFFTLVWATRTGKLDPRPYEKVGTLIPVTAGRESPPPVSTATFGIYVEKMYDFAVQSETISAEGWVWLIWPQEFQNHLDAQKISMADLLIGTNILGASDPAVVPSNENPIKLSDGRFYQIFSFQGRFDAYGLDFRRFPFQTVRLPLTFSLNPENATLNFSQIRLVPDLKQSGIGYHTKIPGYITTATRLEEMIAEFRTHFGLPMDVTKLDSRFSSVQMEVIYHTSFISAFLQLFLPLIVVMTIVLLAPSLGGGLWDVRIALPSTALLTLIFLQQGYRAQLPALPYLTFIDQIYTICYAATVIVFALCVWSSNQLDSTAAADRHRVIERINRIDRRFQIGLAIALVILTIFSWLIPVRPSVH